MWQSQRHIDRAVKMNRLQRAQALIVIHGENGVELPVVRAVKHRVGWKRSLHVQAISNRRLNSGFYDLLILKSKQTIVTRVRIQRANRDFGG